MNRRFLLVVWILCVVVGVVVSTGSAARMPQALPWLVAIFAGFSVYLFQLFQLFQPAPKTSDASYGVETNGHSDENHGLKKYEHKVGGHTSPDGLDVCLLHNNEAEVLKRLQPQPYTMHELEFYGREMPQHENGLLRSVIKYLPKFYGVHEIEGMRYLRLQNLMQNYSKPCILDVKVGRRCYEVSAPEDKKERERQKYPYQETVGYRVAGLKVWNRDASSYVEEIRQGESRTEADMLRGRDLETYFSGCSSTEHKVEVIDHLDGHLGSIELFLLDQTHFELCAVSLLCAYEGDPEIEADQAVAPFVWLVDFAHTTTGCNAVDENFIFGVKTFRRVLARLRDGLEVTYLG